MENEQLAKMTGASIRLIEKMAPIVDEWQIVQIKMLLLKRKGVKEWEPAFIELMEEEKKLNDELKELIA